MYNTNLCIQIRTNQQLAFIEAMARPAWVTEPSVSNQASPSTVLYRCWPDTNNTLPTQLTNLWWPRSCCGLSRHPCGLLWPLCHHCHPKNNVFMTLLQRNQYLLPKTNDKNQSTRITTTEQLLTTLSSPHSGKPRRGVALTCLNAPYFVVGGGIHYHLRRCFR